ncbi:MULTISPECIES: ATP-binding protein [Anaerococcus]|jgi:DNA replication protein dnaC|uniref:Chromosomal replication initiator DnaA n=1 Tax=Anaerococcus octavius TaxID=54007 RepID=A0A2I1M9D0_9FIRM|nr:MULTISPECIES: ATP-binding protein [Anaerococcus]MDU3177186.1 ATP-binding protein [Anaerococcus sp.]PKZ16734.1 chromosomal replication initiator DnaA [Anaerococcus octavius]
METNNKVTHILAQRREQNLIDQKKRINEVYKKIPSMESLDKNIRELGYIIIQDGLKGDDTEKKENDLKQLRIEKARILEANGFEKDYMEIRYHHPICKDTGFVGTKMCSCRKQLIIDQNYSQSNIRSLISRENFRNFDDSLFSDNPYKDYPITPYQNIQHIKKSLYGFINDFDKQNNNLYIFGDVGRGKTYLLNSIAKEILDRNYSVLYMTSSRLFKFLNDYNWAFEEARAKHQEQFDFILDCDLLIIDDLGSEASSKNDSANLFEVVNNRMIAGKPIIFSTNYDETMLSETYGDRIFSRIIGNSEVYEIFGEDLRLKTRNF